MSQAPTQPPAPPEQPNLPEITKTTLPLLSTVLAGFSVTIIASLFITSGYKEGWLPPNLGLFLGLIFLAISVPWFLSSVLFAVWGQAYENDFSEEEMKKRYYFVGDDYEVYMNDLKKKWRNWQDAAYVALTIGIAAFVTGTDILVWNFVGPLAGLIFLMMVLIPSVWGIWIRVTKRG